MVEIWLDYAIMLEQGWRNRLPRYHLVDMISVLVSVSCPSLPNLVGMAYSLVNFCSNQLRYFHFHVDCRSIKNRKINYSESERHSIPELWVCASWNQWSRKGLSQRPKMEPSQRPKRQTWYPYADTQVQLLTLEATQAKNFSTLVFFQHKLSQNWPKIQN